MKNNKYLFCPGSVSKHELRSLNTKHSGFKFVYFRNNSIAYEPWNYTGAVKLYEYISNKAFAIGMTASEIPAICSVSQNNSQINLKFFLSHLYNKSEAFYYALYLYIVSNICHKYLICQPFLGPSEEVWQANISNMWCPLYQFVSNKCWFDEYSSCFSTFPGTS